MRCGADGVGERGLEEEVTGARACCLLRLAGVGAGLRLASQRVREQIPAGPLLAAAGSRIALWPLWGSGDGTAIRPAMFICTSTDDVVVVLL